MSEWDREKEKVEREEVKERKEIELRRGRVNGVDDIGTDSERQRERPGTFPAVVYAARKRVVYTGWQAGPRREQQEPRNHNRLRARPPPVEEKVPYAMGKSASESVMGTGGVGCVKNGKHQNETLSDAATPT